MKNTISITSNCVCTCVDSTNDGSNSIYVSVEVGNAKNAKLNIYLNEVLNSSVNLTSNEINVVPIPTSLYITSAVVKFQYVDDSYTGQYFSITFPATLSGDLMVKQTGERSYNVQYKTEKKFYTQDEVDALLADKSDASHNHDDRYYKKTELLNLIYPVGSIYMSVKNVSPATFLGGTWVAWGSGRVPVGVNTSDSNFNTVEKTGGAKTHTLTTAQLPSHNHGSVPFHSSGSEAAGHGIGNLPGFQDRVAIAGKISAENWKTGNTGSGQAHNNLQPYITCYMWKRTA